MAEKNYVEAMKIEMIYEGGKVDDPDDPGGRTNQGVIQRVYSAYRARKGLPIQDVYKMTDAERNDIYRTQYANAVKFDALPPGIDLMLLDGAINSGPAQSIKWLQRVLGLTADGVMGDVTINAVWNQENHDDIVRKWCERRMLFLKNLKHWKKYARGWTARVNGIKAKAQAWARGDVGPAVTYTQDMNRKANLSNAVAAPARAIGDAAGTGGGVTATLSTGIETAQQTLSPLSDNPWVSRILIGLIFAGVVVGVVGAGYAWYARKRKEELEDALDLTPQDAPYNNANTPTEILDLSVAPNEYQGASAIKSI